MKSEQSSVRDCSIQRGGTETFALPDLRGAFPVHTSHWGIGIGQGVTSAGAPAATVAITYGIAVKGMYPVHR